MSYLHDFNMAAFWAGITGFVWYAFGAVPLHIAVSGQLGLTTAQSSSWMFIVWFSGAVSSIALSLCYRQPIPITWTIPGLVYLGTLAGQYTIAEMVGANLIAGALIIALGLMGVGARIMAWLPLPIVMGMFAGSILDYLTRLVSTTVSNIAVAGMTVVAFLLGRAIKSPKSSATGPGDDRRRNRGLCHRRIRERPDRMGDAGHRRPRDRVFHVRLHRDHIADADPGHGPRQRAGHRIPDGAGIPGARRSNDRRRGRDFNRQCVVRGASRHCCKDRRRDIRGPDAGPQSCRYWANVVAASLTILLAVAATPVMSLMGVLPRSYVFALAGLAVLSALQDAFEKAFGGTLRFAALTAFGVAATPFSIAGIASAFWAIIAGMLAALVVERAELLAYWRDQSWHAPSKVA